MTETPLEDLKVYIAGPVNFQVIALFKQFGFVGTNDLMDAHVCVFTGGSDIDTDLYGEKAIPECGWFNEKRDEHEVRVYHNCVEMGIPMVGICRGAQLLNVMNGGKLWQNVDGHRRNHEAFDLINEKVITVTSTHHQMMRPAETAEILMVASRDGKPASLCSVKQAQGVNHKVGPKEVDPEVLWYEETQSLCVQFHPENNNATQECRDYFEALLEEYICPDSEIVVIDNTVE